MNYVSGCPMILSLNIYIYTHGNKDIVFQDRQLFYSSKESECPRNKVSSLWQGIHLEYNSIDQNLGVGQQSAWRNGYSRGVQVSKALCLRLRVRIQLKV